MRAKERAQIVEAMRLLRTDDGYEEAMRILRVLAGGPSETDAEKAIKQAGYVSVQHAKLGPWKLP